MDIQIASLCDSANDYNGKLCLMGAFDTLFSRALPLVYPHCALALRVCFQQEDEGEHALDIRFIDEDGTPIVKPLEPKITVELPEEATFLTRNLILNIQGIKFEKVGQYSIDISVDGRLLARIPLRVLLIEGAENQEG